LKIKKKKLYIEKLEIRKNSETNSFFFIQKKSIPFFLPRGCGAKCTGIELVPSEAKQCADGISSKFQAFFHSNVGSDV